MRKFSEAKCWNWMGRKDWSIVFLKLKREEPIEDPGKPGELKTDRYYEVCLNKSFDLETQLKSLFDNNTDPVVSRSIYARVFNPNPNKLSDTIFQSKLLVFSTFFILEGQRKRDGLLSFPRRELNFQKKRKWRSFYKNDWNNMLVKPYRES